MVLNKVSHVTVGLSQDITSHLRGQHSLGPITCTWVPSSGDPRRCTRWHLIQFVREATSSIHGFAPAELGQGKNPVHRQLAKSASLLIMNMWPIELMETIWSWSLWSRMCGRTCSPSEKGKQRRQLWTPKEKSTKWQHCTSVCLHVWQIRSFTAALATGDDCSDDAHMFCKLEFLRYSETLTIKEF